MTWTQCVIDASFEPVGEAFTFCPIEGDINTNDYKVVTGMNYVSSDPPNGVKLVAIIHPDGQEAVLDFCDKHETLLDSMKNRLLLKEELARKDEWRELSEEPPDFRIYGFHTGREVEIRLLDESIHVTKYQGYNEFGGVGVHNLFKDVTHWRPVLKA